MDERHTTSNSIVRDKRGQSLILALMVMFLLVFIGGVFISLIARNIRRAQRSGEVLTADYLAEAGIRYANDQLTYGNDGADWRPMPETAPNQSDPDYKWLSTGFSRFAYGKGRFLIKLTYDPKPNDPLSKFIKIESIGRMGEVDPNDPTTWKTDQPLRARKEKVAYKAIAITDYARFITNKDKRSGEISLGTPGFVTQFGANDDANNDNTVGVSEGLGGSIRVNGNLLWHGSNYIWLDRLRGEAVEVAGDIRHDTAAPAAEATLVSINSCAPASVKPSSDPAFDTSPDEPAASIGKYRDGRMIADMAQRPRSVFRIEPPLLDVRSPGGGLSRYREITRNSGEWVYSDSEGRWFNRGFYGWGEGVYINNRHDVQRESSIYTLRGNWTRPGSEYWNGPYYTPPGVSILLTPYDLDNEDGDSNPRTGRPDMILTRSGGDDDEAKFIWRDRNGDPLPETAEQVIMPYPENGVIFAEGNIRIKGTLPPTAQLTIVSGATIYVEGNILKYPYDGEGKLLDPEQPRDSAIALLATDNICVNTTQFFSPVWGIFKSGDSSGEEPHFEIGSGENERLRLDFSFGVATDLYEDGGQDIPVSLYIRHTSLNVLGVPSYMNLFVNFPSGNPANPFQSMCHFNVMPWASTDPFPPRREYVYPLADMLAWPQDRCAVQKEPQWEHQVFQLWPAVGNSDYTIYNEPGLFNELVFQLDPNAVSPNLPTANYLLSRAAVQPCDIRIESLLYAQNGSFFIIPGEWFNPDSRDTEDTIGRPLNIVDSRWPFYGQPLDVKITIYGAVSENVPAPIGDVAAWMEKWGWIPREHGNSGELTASYREPMDPDTSNDPKRRGLTIMYDLQLSCPRLNPWDGTSQAIRQDDYQRLLPIVPRLPVSSDTLYFGEPA